MNRYEPLNLEPINKGWYCHPEASIFIDWITIQQTHELGGLPRVNDGKVFSVDEDGAIEWEIERGFSVEGSWQSKVLLQSDGWTVRLSGNIGRFDRPDNIFGYELPAVVAKCNRLLARFDLPPFEPGTPYREVGCDFHKWTGAHLTRLDLTGNFSVGSNENVQPFMNHLAAQSVARMRTGSFPDGYTVDYGRGSKYWYAKAYAKYQQLTSRQQKKRQPLPETLEWVKQVGMVRFELTLKSRFLTQHGLRYLGGCNMSNLRKIFNDKADVVKREKAGHKSFDQIFLGLPRPALETALKWKNGQDITAIPRATLYRHKKIIKDFCDIDISMPCNVVELATRVKVKEITVMPMIAPPDYWEKTGTGI